MRVYLTGGTGLLGSHAAERLRSGGREVVALHRPASDVARLSSLGCELVEGDVRDGPDALARGMEGADAVVHAAALVYAGSWPRVRAVNVEGAEHVARAAALAAVPHLVHLSSVAVYGRVDPDVEEVDEDSPVDTPLAPSNLYARSKREAEVAVRGVTRGGGAALTVLRPSAVYGERDRHLAPRVAAIARLPLVPLLGSHPRSLPVVYAGNVAGAVEEALDQPPEGARARTFDVALDHPLDQRELVEGVARGLGKSPRFVRVPDVMVRAAGTVANAVGMGVPGGGAPDLDRIARLLLRDNPYPSRRIRRELGWAPAYEHAVGMRRTAEWLAGR